MTTNTTTTYPGVTMPKIRFSAGRNMPPPAKPPPPPQPKPKPKPSLAKLKPRKRAQEPKPAPVPPEPEPPRLVGLSVPVSPPLPHPDDVPVTPGNPRGDDTYHNLYTPGRYCQCARPVAMQDKEDDRWSVQMPPRCLLCGRDVRDVR
jgi:hypothetical protein